VKLLIIGGGRIQSYLVHAAHERGLEAVVLDMDPKCYGAGIADYFELCDTTDHRGALDIARKHSVDGVMTAGTDVGYTVAFVAHHMGLPSCHPSAAYSAKNKWRMRELINLEHPIWMRAEGSNPVAWEIHAGAWNVEPYPCVMKPVDLSASRGISVCRTREEYRRAYWNAANVSPSSTVIVEECLGFVDGKYSPGGHREVAIDAALIDGYPFIVNTAERVFSGEHEAIEIGVTAPAFSGRPPLAIQRICEAAVNALGITEGPFKADLIYDERYGWCLLECTTRWSGSFDHNVAASYARDRDFSDDLIEYALTGKFRHELAHIHESPPTRYVSSYCPFFTPGQVITQDIIDLYRLAEGVFDVIKTRDVQPDLTSLAARSLFVFGSGTTVAEAWKVCVDADNYRKRIEATENPTHTTTIWEHYS